MVASQHEICHLRGGGANTIVGFLLPMIQVFNSINQSEASSLIMT